LGTCGYEAFSALTTADGETVVDETLPARYNQETELAAEVEPGDAAIDFPLKSD